MVLWRLIRTELKFDIRDFCEASYGMFLTRLCDRPRRVPERRCNCIPLHSGCDGGVIKRHGGRQGGEGRTRGWDAKGRRERKKASDEGKEE